MQPPPPVYELSTVPLPGEAGVSVHVVPSVLLWTDEAHPYELDDFELRGPDGLVGVQTEELRWGQGMQLVRLVPEAPLAPDTAYRLHRINGEPVVQGSLVQAPPDDVVSFLTGPVAPEPASLGLPEVRGTWLGSGRLLPETPFWSGVASKQGPWVEVSPHFGVILDWGEVRAVVVDPEGRFPEGQPWVADETHALGPDALWPLGEGLVPVRWWGLDRHGRILGPDWLDPRSLPRPVGLDEDGRLAQPAEQVLVVLEGGEPEVVLGAPRRGLLAALGAALLLGLGLRLWRRARG